MQEFLLSCIRFIICVHFFTFQSVMLGVSILKFEFIDCH